ncbi:MAG: hypothetical protein IAE99_02910 [Rhodothermales bacterium]|nr:hypothetical protein [Rhodothermales bacterium]MCA0270360.1 hypothetical protein [Bacteroidota bacterium]
MPTSLNAQTMPRRFAPLCHRTEFNRIGDAERAACVAAAFPMNSRSTLPLRRCDAGRGVYDL